MLNNLKKLRISKGLTQNEIARSVGITVVTYQNYEYGTREPKVSFAIKLAKVLNITVEDLFPLSGQTERE